MMKSKGGAQINDEIKSAQINDEIKRYEAHKEMMKSKDKYEAHK